MTSRVFVIGVGMTTFEKPGACDWDCPDMGWEAGQRALVDAGINYEQVDHDDRQVPNVKANVGLGGAAVVTIYEKAAA